MQLLLVFLISFSTLVAETYIINSSNVIKNMNSVKHSKTQKLIKKEILFLEDFTKLNLHIPATFIVYTHSKKNMITMEIDEEFADAINTYITNKVLMVEASKNILTKLPINITIYCREGIKKILTNSAMKLEISGVKESHFELIANGISKIKFNQGTIDNLTIHSKGTYSLDLKQIDAKNVFIKAKGIGKIKLQVSDFLEVKLFNLAKVYYSGQPKIKQSLKGLSKLNRR